MSDTADSPIWSRSSDLLCSYSSRAMTHAVCKCLSHWACQHQSVWRFPLKLGRDFLLIKLSSPTYCSHKPLCCTYMKICVFAVVQPQINTGKSVLESNKYDKHKILLIHVIVSLAAFPFIGGSPWKIGLHYLLPSFWNCFGNMKGKCQSIFR